MNLSTYQPVTCAPTLRPMSRFNVRVYGILIDAGRLLVNEEIIRGRPVVKLPGGGLEPGEGLMDGLRREWREELGLELSAISHFYTTDFYQPSYFDDSQVISVYYKVAVAAAFDIVNTVAEERTYWLPMEAVGIDTFTLPIDRVVGGMLAKERGAAPG